TVHRGRLGRRLAFAADLKVVLAGAADTFDLPLAALPHSLAELTALDRTGAVGERLEVERVGHVLLAARPPGDAVAVLAPGDRPADTVDGAGEARLLLAGEVEPGDPAAARLDRHGGQFAVGRHHHRELGLVGAGVRHGHVGHEKQLAALATLEVQRQDELG